MGHGGMKVQWVLGLIALIITYLFYLLVNKAPHYCAEQNRVLTDQEKIETVVTTIIKYPKITYRKAWQGEPGEGKFADGEWWLPFGKADGGGQKMKKPSTPIYYKNVKEFFTFNPSCCFVTQRYNSIYNIGGDDVSFWDRRTGRKTAIVVVLWLLRYTDEDGMPQTKALERFQAVDNCGNFVNDFE